MKSFRFCFCVTGLIAATLVFNGCASADPPDKQAGPEAKGGKDAEPGPQDHSFDPLVRGDKIEINLRGVPQPIPPSEQIIAQDGTITLENIGAVEAAGLTPKKLEEAIHDKYVPAYFTRITVNVTPLLRYIYITGQVNNKGGNGRITYTSAITVTQAIAAAGDFTDYAKKNQVRLIRANGTKITVDCTKILKGRAVDPQVAPGDTIYVPMRHF